MQRFGLLAGLLIALWVPPTPLHAALCTLDAVPAATLLYPYFEVDAACGAMPSQNTEFSVTNTHHVPVVARVVLWTNSGVPGLSFDVYLNGYDQQTVDLERVFCDGFLPSTGSGVVPGPGRFSGAAVAFAGCNATATPGAAPVYGGDGAITAGARAELRARFTGQPLPSNATMCYSRPNGRSSAEGYITVDAVTRCGAAPHSDPGFGAHLSASNVLIGSALLYNNGDSSSYALSAVPIEATAGGELDESRSFYSHPFVSAGPRREPLPTSWTTEQGGAGLNASLAELIVWRAPPGVGTPFTCASGPSWYPLQLDNKSGFSSRGVFHVRDDGSAVRSQRLAPVPLMTQRVEALEEFPELQAMSGGGWTYLNLSRADAITFYPAQAWVATVRRSPGRFALLHEGAPLGDACDGTPFTNTSAGPLTDLAGSP
jgi:hypothetical protein